MYRDLASSGPDRRPEQTIALETDMWFVCCVSVGYARQLGKICLIAMGYDACGRKRKAIKISTMPRISPGLAVQKAASLERGPVAQRGARFHGMEEVIGSIPIRSTK
jgi:hypothetical protein